MSHRPARRRLLALGATTALVLSLLSAGALVPKADAAVSTGTVVASSADAIHRPWLGYGVNYYPEPGDTAPTSYTPAEQALDTSRLNSLQPQIVRLTWNVSFFDPTSTVGDYDWSTLGDENEYAALNYLKAHNIPVMTGWWSTPFSAVSSGYATVVADFLRYLVVTLGYTNIRYWDGINEPNHRDPSTYANFETQARNTQTAIQADDLDVAVIGPGTQDTDADDWITSSASDLSGVLGAYDKHLYPTGTNDVSDDSQESYLSSLIGTVDENDPSNKPFIIEEMGDKCCGYDSTTDSQPAVLTDTYGLDMADLGVQAARAGASAPMAWWLDDLGNKEWGMYDAASSDTNLRPWSFTWWMLERTVPAGAQLYAPADPTGVRTLAAEVPDGSTANWTFLLVNRNSTAVDPTVSAPGWGQATLLKYAYDAAPGPTDASGFPVPTGTESGDLNSGITVNVPADSVVALTTLDGGEAATPSTQTVGIQTDTDYLNDWSNTTSRTGGWILDTTNANADFEGDASRARRSSNTTQSIVYPADGLSGFSARIFFFNTPTSANGRVGFAVSSSPTGPWTFVPYTQSSAVSTGSGGWYVADFTPTSALPSGSNYLQISLLNDPTYYEPQLGQINLTHANT